ncbi:MAG: hypothetical protein WA946_08940 [Nitrospirota bacterium]
MTHYSRSGPMTEEDKKDDGGFFDSVFSMRRAADEIILETTKTCGLE